MRKKSSCKILKKKMKIKKFEDASQYTTVDINDVEIEDNIQCFNNAKQSCLISESGDIADEIISEESDYVVDYHTQPQHQHLIDFDSGPP